MLPEQKRPSSSTTACHCCQLVRSDKSSRLILPLARRGRPHVPSRSHRFLCRNCLNIKREQENDILQQHVKTHRNDQRHAQNIFETINDLNKTFEQDISHEIEFSLTNDNDKLHLNTSEYEAEQMLVWQINTSDHLRQTNTINDTGSLTDNEKKILLQEAVRKLQIVLSNRSTSTTTTTATTTIPESDLDQIEFTYRALQTTVNILSSSLDSL